MRRVDDWISLALAMVVVSFLAVMFWEVFIEGGLSAEVIRSAMPR